MTDQRQRRLIVVASLFLILVANGGLFLLVVGLKQVALDFGWPRAVPSLAYAFLYIGTGFGGIIMGYWFDRSGARPVTLLGTIMIGSGAMLTSAVQTEWQLYLIYGLMMGLLGQATLFGPLVLNIMRWFEKRRGFAVGLITAGQGLAGAIWPPVFRHFNETAGWRETFFWFGLFLLLTATPLTFMLGKRKAAAPMRSSQTSGTAPDKLSPVRVESVMPTWLLQTTVCLAIVGCCVSMAMPLAHLVAHASDLGHATSRAAEMLATALLAATVVRIIAGSRLVDRLGGLIALIIFSATQTAALVLYAVVDGLLALYLVSILFGLGYGGINMCYPVIVREYLPAAEAGRRLGFVLLFGALGMALGGWLAGFMFDQTGTYTSAFLVGVAFNLANLTLLLTLVNATRSGRLQTTAG